jgi:hypothetical protein
MNPARRDEHPLADLRLSSSRSCRAAALDVALDPPEVLADEREDEALDAEHEEDGDAAEERPGKFDWSIQ